MMTWTNVIKVKSRMTTANTAPRIILKNLKITNNKCKFVEINSQKNIIELIHSRKTALTIHMGREDANKKLFRTIWREHLRNMYAADDHTYWRGRCFKWLISLGQPPYNPVMYVMQSWRRGNGFYYNIWLRKAKRFLHI